MVPGCREIIDLPRIVLPQAHDIVFDLGPLSKPSASLVSGDSYRVKTFLSPGSNAWPNRF
jgi:hypothetical protein